MRNYLRISPSLIEDKEADGYTPPAIAAYIALLCEAEKQAPRGRFRNLAILRAHLGRHARWVDFMLAQHDLEVLQDDSFYVVGWDEWQEGNWPVKERMERVNAQRGRPATEVKTGATRTANWRLRTRVFERDAYTCRYCGDTDYDRQWLVLEHVIPDGPDTFENLVTSCRPCNKKKGPRTPEEAGMALLPVPGDTSHGSDGDASREVASRGDVSRDASPLPTAHRSPPTAHRSPPTTSPDGL